MPDDDPVALDGHQDGQPPVLPSLDAITTLIHSFASMISAMEKRITDRIVENAALSKERWARWERDFERYRETTDKRLAIVEDRLELHLKKEEKEAIVAQARVEPIRHIALWIGGHWRDIIILLIGILAILGFSGETLGKLVGQ